MASPSIVSPVPTEIKLHKRSATLELVYDNGDSCVLSAEFLRVHSPSAEVRGHGKQQEVLQTGKREVKIISLETVGNYALKPTFDDGHHSGIYSWDYLKELVQNQQMLWQDYLTRLQLAGASRDQLPPDTRVIKVKPAPSV
ncbi:MAG: DUF971 domain-containing protein [Gammaproteobacteria bacterium]|nr:DUF971 domain-containing protein [Gammaproteobacteria bacterium]